METLKDRYPDSETLYLVDAAITTTPKSVRQLTTETGCSVAEVQKAVRWMLRNSLIGKRGARYFGGSA